MRNLILAAVLALGFSGCGIIAKSAPEIRYFTLAKGDFKICKEQADKKQIYIATVKSQAASESRDILISGNDGAIYPLKSAKWISLPSEMIYERILNTMHAGCLLQPSFDKTNLNLQITLISLEAGIKNAKITLAFSLVKNGQILKSEIISASKPINSNLDKDVVTGLNLALDEAVNEILKRIKEVK